MDDVTDAAVESLAKELGSVPYQYPIERIHNIARHVLTSRQPKPEDLERVAEIVWPWLRIGMHGVDRHEWKDINKGSLAHDSAHDCARAILALFAAPPEDARLAAANARIAELEANVVTLRSDRDKWMLVAFSPVGDNHHNALLCPYCNPTGLAAQSPTIRLGEGLTEAQIEKIVEEVFTKSSRRNGWMRTWSDSSIESNNYWRSMVQDTICALRAGATPKPEPVDWLARAQRQLERGDTVYGTDAIMAGLCEQIADLKAKVV